MNINQTIKRKIIRLAAGSAPRVLDLFSGCGGLSLGFRASGCEIIGAVELDPLAAASHGKNFHNGDIKHSMPRDIISTSPFALAKELKLGPVESAVDVVVGGPPCQAFARVGRSKLREINDHPEAFKHDVRAQLYLRYLDYVEAFQPLALLMENVPDMLNHGGHNIAEEICEVLEERGYTAQYTLLNAVYYGVPQMRERMFLVAFRRELATSFSFPEPTHWVNLPRGYEGSRQVALKPLRTTLLMSAHRYVEPPAANFTLSPAITAQEAIGDLPPITLHLEGKLTRGARRFTEIIPYDKRRRQSSYAKAMREWPGFESETGLRDHVIRYLPRDWKLFKRMECGQQYPELHALAISMFHEALNERKFKGEVIRKGSAEYKRLYAEFVPPYDPGKFPNKWWKLSPDKPVRTLMAHLGKDSYSHIHYDSEQARTISVREAARLQSFPDGFLFEGTMNPAFRQIGNAVPPLMARSIAVELVGELRKARILNEKETCGKKAVSV